MLVSKVASKRSPQLAPKKSSSRTTIAAAVVKKVAVVLKPDIDNNRALAILKEAAEAHVVSLITLS